MDDTTVPAPDARDPAPAASRESGERADAVEALVARLGDERLEVLPFFHDLRNQIVHPLNVHVETRYFFRKWKAELGPVLTLLIMELRDRCYYNPRTGERRDYCWPSQEELARAIGVSVRTVIRALQDPLAARFIRVRHRYRYDPALGKKVRTSSAYLVSMDDPLRPEDEAVLTRMVAERILAEETAQRDRLIAGQRDADSPFNPDDARRSPDDEPPAGNAAPVPIPPTRPASRRSGPDRLPPDHLTADLSARSRPHLRDNLSPTSSPLLTDKLSALTMSDKLAEEEVPGRDTPQNQDDQPSSAASSLAGRPDALERVARTYADANDRPPTPLERQRLAELAARFDPVARRATPRSTGADWVIAAIVEAVDSGSAFVAPRRVATICERWSRAATAPGRARPSARKVDPTPSIDSSEDRPGPGEAEESPAPVDPFEEVVEVAIPAFVVSASRPMANWQLWRLVSDELVGQPVGARHRRWLDQATIVGEVDGALLVGAPSSFARDLLERRLGDAIRRVIAAVLGEARPVRFVVSRDWLEGRESE